MIWLREWFKADRSDDSGFTITELVVACLVLGIVLSTGFLVLTGAMNTAKGTSNRLNDINTARLAVSAMSRSLRTAVLPSQLNDNTSSVDAAFISGGPTSVSFYADINNPATLPASGSTIYGPSQVTYTVSPTGTLTQTIQPPNSHDVTDNNYQYCTPGTPGCTVYTTILARNIDANTTTKPLLTYYDASGNPLGALTAANLDDVDSIDIRVGLDTDTTSPMGTTSYTTRVSLPNHESLLRQQNGS